MGGRGVPLTIHPSSAGSVLHPMYHRVGRFSAGRGVRRTPLLTSQWLQLWARQRRLRLHTQPRGPDSSHLHLRGSGGLPGHNWDPHSVLPGPDRAEPGPGTGLCRRGLHHVEAPVPGLFCWAADRFSLLQMAKGLTE